MVQNGLQRYKMVNINRALINLNMMIQICFKQERIEQELRSFMQSQD